jgi:hypothetical protein
MTSSVFLLLLSNAVGSDGIVANSRTAAVANRERIIKAFSTNPPRTVTLPPGNVYIDGTITTKPVVGCGRFKCDGSFGYGDIDPQHPTLGGGMTRLVQVGKGPLLRLSGAGFVAEDPMEWVGEQKPDAAGAKIEHADSTIIEVEGRAAVATGRHRFRNQVFTDAAIGFRCLAGYFAEGKFVADENHADNTIVDGCEFSNIGRVFVSENQQALVWKFRDPVVNWTNDRSCVFADLLRGGSLTIDGLVINHPRLTIFKLRDYSPNNCQLTCRNFWSDMPTTEEHYLTLVEYVGPANAVKYSSWVIDISGFVPTYQKKFDRRKLYVGCEGLPRKYWRDGVVIMGESAAAK